MVVRTEYYYLHTFDWHFFCLPLSREAHRQIVETLRHIKFIEYDYWDGGVWGRRSLLKSPKTVRKEATARDFTGQRPAFFSSFWNSSYGADEFMQIIWQRRVAGGLVAPLFYRSKSNWSKKIRISASWWKARNYHTRSQLNQSLSKGGARNSQACRSGEEKSIEMGPFLSSRVRKMGAGDV